MTLEHTLDWLAQSQCEDSQNKRQWADEQLEERSCSSDGEQWENLPIYRSSSSLLQVLIELNDPIGLQRALRLGADVTSASPQLGKTPLQEAAESNQLECLELLLAFGANLEQHDGNGDTALHYAAGGNAVQAAEWLLQKGARVNAHDGVTGKTPAFDAFSPEMTELMFRYGADPLARDATGDTLLSYAIMSEDPKLVQNLLGHGCDINQRDGGAWTPLQLSINRGNRAVFQLLLDHGACVDHDPSDPLFHMLADHHRLEWAGALLTAGADPHLTNQAKQTVLEYIQEKLNNPVLAASWRQLMIDHHWPSAKPKGLSPRF